MSRDLRLYLDDILEATDKIISYIRELDQASFESDRQVVDAVLFNLYIIGEAVRNIPDNVRSQYPDIDWKDINSLRNIIAHIYFGIDLQQIWEIVEKDVPKLKVDIAQMLEDMDSGKISPIVPSDFPQKDE